MVAVNANALGLNFDHWCFACGRANPIGLHLDLVFVDGGAEARFVPRPEHQGYDEMVHGGIVAALLDEVMGWAIFHRGIWAVTTRLRITLRRPVAVGDEVRVRGEVVRDRGRAVELRAQIRRASDDELLASAEATYVRMSDSKRRELVDKYGDPAPALARLAAAERGTG